MRAKDAEEQWQFMHNRIKDIELLPEETVKQYLTEQNSIIESLSLLQKQQKKYRREIELD